jgi:hypothetical protein
MGIPIIKPLPMVIQKLCIQERFPQFQYSSPQSAWIGKLKPSERSIEYSIKVSYRPHGIPQVFVLAPRLHPDAPHIYKDTGALCLYYPEDNSWNSQKLLGNTIFLWTAEWLYYYELWLASGQWFGPEAPHRNNKVENHPELG